MSASAPTHAPTGTPPVAPAAPEAHHNENFVVGLIKGFRKLVGETISGLFGIGVKLGEVIEGGTPAHH